MDLSTLPPVPDSPDDLLKSISWPGSVSSHSGGGDGSHEDEDESRHVAKLAATYPPPIYEPSGRPFSPTRPTSARTLSLDTTNLDSATTITASDLSAIPQSTESLMNSIVENFFTPIERSSVMLNTREDEQDESSPRSAVVVVGYQSPTTTTTGSERYETGSMRSLKFEELERNQQMPFVPVPETEVLGVAKEEQVEVLGNMVNHAAQSSRSDENVAAGSLEREKDVANTILDSRRSSITVIKSPEPASAKIPIKRETRESAPSPPDSAMTNRKLASKLDKTRSSVTAVTRVHQLRSNSEARHSSPARSNILVPIPIGVTTSEDSSDAEPQVQVPMPPAPFVDNHHARSRVQQEGRRGNLAVPTRLSRPSSPQQTRPPLQPSQSSRSAQASHAGSRHHFPRVKRDTLDSTTTRPTASNRRPSPPTTATSTGQDRNETATTSLLQQVKDKLRTDETWIYVLRGLIAEYDENRQNELKKERKHEAPPACLSQRKEANGQGVQVSESMSREMVVTMPRQRMQERERLTTDFRALSDTEIDVRLLTPRKPASEINRAPSIAVQAPISPPPSQSLAQRPDLALSARIERLTASRDLAVHSHLNSPNSSLAPPINRSRVSASSTSPTPSPIVKSRPLRCLTGLKPLKLNNKSPLSSSLGSTTYYSRASWHS
ncbi:hypothetical protein ACM66B_002547 [Microbotryomycetes sp. NB124-2]